MCTFGPYRGPPPRRRGRTGFATMSTGTPAQERRSPERSPDRPFPSSQHPGPQRVLACVRCQQRKVRCNRQFPCSNCIRAQAQCVPATLARRRRPRRFPQRELLERLRRYEDLLRQNNVAFEPLHKNSLREKEPPNAKSGSDSDGGYPETMEPDPSTPSTTVKSEGGYKAKYALLMEKVQDDSFLQEILARHEPRSTTISRNI